MSCSLRVNDRKRLIQPCALALALSCIPAPAAAEQRFRVQIEPTLTSCVGGSPCSSGARISFGVTYGVFRSKARDLRLRVSRDFQHNEDGEAGDIDVSTRRWYGQRDAFDVRLRHYSDSGAIAATWHAGFEYKPALPGPQHTIYASYDPYFGPQVLRGVDGPAHRFDIQIRLFENANRADMQTAQSFVAVTPGITLPLNKDGTLRARAAYTIQRQFAGSGHLVPYSGRLFASLTYDFTGALSGYLQVESTNRSAISETTLTAGAKFEF